MNPTDITKITNMFSIATDPRLQRAFAQLVFNLINTKSCIMSKWARSSYNFAAFIKKTYRFFRNSNVNWKMNHNILQFILPRFKNKRYIPVLIDPSFIKNKILGAFTKTKKDQQKADKGFLLLSAALPVRGRAISFFQAYWRNTQISYMVHKSYNEMISIYLIKIKSLLKPVLSKAVFIMDRGFGYEHFLKKLRELEVNYVVRVRDLKTHVMLVRSKKRYPISNLVDRINRGPKIFKIVYKWDVPTYLVIVKDKHGRPWVLATNINDPEAVVKLYKQRMKIEETFKDWKSTGFNIEKLALRQWDLVPKMIWCVVIAHMILYLLGEAIDKSKRHKKFFKRFIQNRKNLSCVQLAWNSWLFALNDISSLFSTLNLNLNALRKVSL